MENLEGNWVNLLCIVFKKTKQNPFFFSSGACSDISR